MKCGRMCFLKGKSDRKGLYVIKKPGGRRDEEKAYKKIMESCGFSYNGFFDDSIAVLCGVHGISSGGRG